MIKGIAHVCLGTTDLAATQRFYCDGLGMTKRFDFVRDGEMVGFYLHAGGNSFIEVFKDKTIPSGGSAMRHLCLETDDIDGIIARLNERGIKVGEKKLGADHSWQVWISAPDGVAIEFHQYTAQSCQSSGAPCDISAKW